MVGCHGVGKVAPVNYYLVSTPIGQLVWIGDVEVVPGGIWLLSPGLGRIWVVASDAVRKVTKDEALAHLATVGKAKR